jgi:hypothetical protein
MNRLVSVILRSGPDIFKDVFFGFHFLSQGPSIVPRLK